MFLKLSGQIEGQLREAYAKKHAAGILNQSILADRLGVDRSVINRRLTGKANMTEETIADMVWGLEFDIDVNIFDPAETQNNHRPPATVSPPVPAVPPSQPISNAGGPSSNTTITATVGAPLGQRVVVAG